MTSNDDSNKKSFWQKVRDSVYITCPHPIIYPPLMPIVPPGGAIISKGLAGLKLGKEIAKIASKTKI